MAFSYGKRRILEDVTFEVTAGSSLAITGPTGCGKSTLLSLITGNLSLPHGRICVAGIEVGKAKGRTLADLRLHEIGMVHQTGELIESLSAMENVMVPMLLTKETNWRNARERALQLLDQFGVISIDLAAGSLSGGERQRVALARALANSPSVLIADEPTASLDPEASGRVTTAIYEQASVRSCAVLVVTHDAQVANRADRTATLADGRLRLPQSCTEI